MQTESNCKYPDCERRLYERINSCISWKVATAIVTILCFGIVASFTYTTMQTGKVSDQAQRDFDRQERAIQQMNSKLDTIIASLITERKR